MSGEGASARASAARRASPPDKDAGSSSPERPSSFSRYSARCRPSAVGLSKLASTYAKVVPKPAKSGYCGRYWIDAPG
jgi:hypothetical protein